MGRRNLTRAEDGREVSSLLEIKMPGMNPPWKKEQKHTSGPRICVTTSMEMEKKGEEIDGWDEKLK